jgi:hypothetical protein
MAAFELDEKSVVTSIFSMPIELTVPDISVTRVIDLNLLNLDSKVSAGMN